MPGTDQAPDPRTLDAAPDFRRLPEPIALADTIAGQDVRPVPDPDGGRDPNHEWMIRHA